ncbi:lytic transglycosylase domain-containing protein [Puniceicoccus vermicola]|uniref:Lytic transglycosylase domain-containing protein n=1 Tax=Puniceicoccus vermicola TaxID=388746 RepID=A0A7X1AV65_9BACT|nr:lytic transglycosylase domain-containing protein [Puniceicoccus vermicola]MBC2600610.1 lytic transglycosylase domain-containing protein [Puniceicoccus vermicola]
MHHLARLSCYFRAKVLVHGMIFGIRALGLSFFSLSSLSLLGQTPEISREQVDQVVDLALDMGQAWQNGELPDLAFTPDELQGLATQLQTALESNQLDDLASFEAMIPQMMLALSQTENGRHYVAWLLQRYDYAVVANWSRQEAAEVVEQSETQPTPEQVEEFRDDYVMDLRVWRHRIAERQAPQPAPGLLPLVKGKFAEKGVPTELIWLAEVESSFDPEAISPVGAKGLFQFMPATAEWMGLEVTPDDERVNASKSASAAAKYLRYLYGRFESWPLVFAAYNAGEGRVRRLMREQSATDFNGIAAVLPSETRMYVPKVLATIELREGVNPSQIAAPSE